ncbi:ADP-ribosyl cyclase/cyclic ADP-ribose hydrolase [Raphanus sativus]|nr:ADP-ribosyl cyclase/cyclic ADP-ribose hydrolase [Raphanus sativus]
MISRCAFGEDIKEQNRPELELSKRVNDYANGNPLALSFYGSELKGKNLSEMKTTFLNFELQTPNMFQDLLNSSYETLNDNEKEIFLDIACFFKGNDVEYVKQLLDGCGMFPHVGIDVLMEKCLVTLSKNRVEMHRIVQNFGRELNNRETIGNERGRRLWEPSTIKFLLEANGQHPEETSKRALVTEDIKAISLHSADLRFDVKPTAFVNMLNLRFLKIYYFNDESISGLRLPEGLDSLPDGLRLLHWEKYPLQSLPQDFDTCHLVQLNMPYSQLQKLWRGTKNLDMLKMARLCHSLQLTEIDDICKAQNIELIDLEGCTKLQSFPATDQLQHLRVVNLSGCSVIKNFPLLSPNIEELNLHGTAIRDDNSGSRCIEVRHAKRGKFYILEGEQKDEHSVSLTFRLVYENGCKLIISCFSIYQTNDTAYKVSREMTELLELTDLHVTFIAELIDILLVNLIPTWKTRVTVDHIIHPLRNDRSEATTQTGEASDFRYYVPVSHSETSDSSEEGETEEKEGSSNHEANEQGRLEEEKRLRQELVVIEAEYLEEMKAITRKRKAIMETKKKLSLI